MSEVIKIINISEGDPFYDFFVTTTDDAVYSSDVYVDPAAGIGQSTDNFGAKVCINGVIFDATISGQIHL